MPRIGGIRKSVLQPRSPNVATWGQLTSSCGAKSACHSHEFGARPIESIEDLDRYALDVWETDEELEAFLAHVRAQRNADLA